MSIQFNLKALFCVLGGGISILYLAYTSLPSVSNIPDYRSYASADSWKRGHSIVGIPNGFWQLSDSVRYNEAVVKFETKDMEEVSVYYQRVRPSHDDTQGYVVFLHGNNGSSQKWMDLGSLHLAANMDYVAIALDLPGWGKTPAQPITDEGEFMTAFFESLEIERPVIVASSAGGYYALPYLMQPSPITCESRVSGFVTVGMVGAEMFTPSQYHRCNVRTMIVYGEKDKEVSLHSVGDLRNLADNAIFPMEKAGHSCHYERPDEWHTYLYNFLKILRKS